MSNHVKYQLGHWPIQVPWHRLSFIVRWLPMIIKICYIPFEMIYNLLPYLSVLLFLLLFVWVTMAMTTIKWNLDVTLANYLSTTDWQCPHTDCITTVFVEGCHCNSHQYCRTICHGWQIDSKSLANENDLRCGPKYLHGKWINLVNQGSLLLTEYSWDWDIG